MALPPLATTAQLAGRLGQGWPDGAAQVQWEMALGDASSTIRSVVGQPITAGTATLLLETDRDGRARLGLSPAVVTGVSWNGSTVPASQYWLHEGHMQTLLPRQTLLVTVSYGWAEVPDEIVKWTCALAVAQINAAETGSLGVSGGVVTSIRVDDAAVNYAPNPDGTVSADLPETVKTHLRQTYGGTA